MMISVRGDNMKISGIMASALLLSAGSAEAITYFGSMTAGGTTATYQIETDGTLGALATGNFLSSSGTVNSLSGTATFTNGNFNSTSGGVAYATASQLFFDTTGEGYLTIGAFGSSFVGFCLAAGIFANCGLSPNPAVLVAVSYPSDFEITLGSGQILVGSTVPEPASWAMLIAGFGLTGAALRRRRASVAQTA
jgi:hypothetical protein